jgi:hypothetical protein
MTLRRWVVYEGGQPQSEVDVAIGPDGDASPKWSVKTTTLHGGLSEGVVAVEVDNGLFRFVILPTRGMSLWRGWIDGRMVGWKSWVEGPVHPRHVALDEPSGCGWLAGFDELLVRCGLASNGPPEFGYGGELVHPQHGRIANLAARDLEATFDDATGEISVKGVVEERHGDYCVELHATFRTRIGQTGLVVHDEIHNFSESPVPTQLLYHVNFGAPLLEEGSRVIAPVQTLVPRERYETKWNTYWNDPAAEEEVYFGELAADGLDRTRVLLRNKADDFGASLTYDVRQLPCFTLWKMMGSGDGGQVTGLEPGTNFPNQCSFEAARGRTRVLAHEESASFDIELNLHVGPEAVQLAATQIDQLQATTQRRVFTEPQPGWSPNC